MVVYTASNSDVIFEVSGVYYRFGVGVRVSDYTERYAKGRHWRIGDRVVNVVAETGYHGAIAVEFIMDTSMRDWAFKLFESGDLEYLNLYYKVAGTWYKLEGVKFDNVRMGANVEDVVKITAEGKYKQRSVADLSGVTIPSAEAVYPQSFNRVSVKFSLDGVDYTGYISTVNLSVRHNLAELYELGNVHPAEIKEQRYEVDWDMTVYFVKGESDSNWGDVFDGFGEGKIGSIEMTFVGNSNLVMSIDNAWIERVSVPSEEANVIKMRISGYGDKVVVS